MLRGYGPRDKAAAHDEQIDGLIRVLAPEVSAFLLDARFGLAQAILSRALPGRVGLMASIEDEDYRHAPGARRTRLREHWGTRQLKLIGADVGKLLWFYRPDAPSAAHQRRVVEQLVAECRDLSLPLVVEPIWYALDGEDTASSAWRRRRVDGIIESAHVAAELGVDMLKVEFPGDVGSEEGRDAAAEACARLDAAVEVPWVILSAGVGYADFKRQVEIASAAGGSGFPAGRSIWRDAVSIHVRSGDISPPGRPPGAWPSSPRSRVPWDARSGRRSRARIWSARWRRTGTWTGSVSQAAAPLPAGTP